MNDEIDLIEVSKDLWNGKWKIFFSILLALLIGFGFNLTQPAKIFYSTTDVKPLNYLEVRKYNLFNSYLSLINSSKSDEINSSKSDDNFRIEPDVLIESYTKLVEDKSLFIQAIENIKVIKLSDYENENLYKDSISKQISTITLTKINNNENFFQIKQSSFNEQIWKKILAEFNALSNEIIRKDIIQKFEDFIIREKFKTEIKKKELQRMIKFFDSIELNNQSFNLFINPIDENLFFIDNNFIEELEIIFKNMSVLNKENFIAVDIQIENTSFIYDNFKKLKTYILALIFGIFFGILLVYISKTINKLKSS